MLTKIAALNPDGLYYGGVQQAGEKLAAQAYDLMPNMPKMGGDGMYSVGFTTDVPQAAENWYATIAAPDTHRRARGCRVGRHATSRSTARRPTTTR